MKFAIVLYVLLTCIAGSANAVLAQAVSTEAPAPARIDITKVTCRNLLDANPLDRAAVVMFYWGYAAAKSGVSSFKPGVLRTATVHLMDVCKDRPSDTILSAMQSVDIKAF